jgi:hypothetical protein
MTEYMTFRTVEVRDTPDGDGRTIIGLAVPFDEVGQGPRGPEVVKAGAFRRTLDHLNKSGRRLKALRNHDTGHPVGTLVRAEESPSGLDIEVRMADTAAGDEALREVRAGMLDSFSIGFVANRERRVDGVRQLLEVALHEVSLVAVPAYAGARVAEVREHPTIDLSKYQLRELPVSLLDDVRRFG